jgi:hypothetical protein
MEDLSFASFVRLEGRHDGEAEPKLNPEILKQLDNMDKLGKCKDDDIYFNFSNISLGVVCGFKVGSHLYPT